KQISLRINKQRLILSVAPTGTILVRRNDGLVPIGRSLHQGADAPRSPGKCFFASSEGSPSRLFVPPRFFHAAIGPVAVARIIHDARSLRRRPTACRPIPGRCGGGSQSARVLREQGPPAAGRAVPGMPRPRETEGQPAARFSRSDSQGGRFGAGTGGWKAG